MFNPNMSPEEAQALQERINAMTDKEQLQLVIAQMVREADSMNDTILTVVVQNAEKAELVKEVLDELDPVMKEVFSVNALTPTVAEGLDRDIAFIRMSDVQMKGLNAMYIEFMEWLNTRFAGKANLPMAEFANGDGSKFRQVPLVVPTQTFYNAYVSALVGAWITARANPNNRIVTPTEMLKGQ